MKKGLLIGAGFSYDLGMPLAKSLTQDFFYFLNPERMKKFIEMWKSHDPYGKDRPIDPVSMDIIYEIYQKYHSGQECNYEDFLKEIQNRHKLERSQSCIDGLHYAFGKFFDIIYQMFWMYHINNLAIYQINKKYYSWLSQYVTNNELWVLSLNHDLFIEFLCFEYDIPLSFGSKKNILFPQSNINREQSIKLKEISRNDMVLRNMSFFENRSGINLIKLHGAINEFSFDNDKRVAHIAYEKNESFETYLKKVSNILHEPHYYINGNPVFLGSEIAISDFEGEMQFLSKSMLTGGYKYSETFDPKPGEEKMGLMAEALSKIDELTIVGYGFGDPHINLRLYNAMLLNKNLSIVIVVPFLSKTPEILKPFDYKMRIRRVMSGMAEWMEYSKSGKWDSEQIKELKEMRLVRQKLEEHYRKRFL